MPKPFWYYVDFITSPVTTAEQYQNIESIRGMLLGNNVQMTIYAMAGIITAAYIVSNLETNHVGHIWNYIADRTPPYRDSYGLWQQFGYDPDDPPTTFADGITQCDVIIDLCNTGNGYVPRDDNRTSLSSFLSSTDNDYLGLIFVKNAVVRYDIPPGVFDNPDYITAGREAYTQILTYLLTNDPKINPASIAILKKKRKRWWK